MGKVFRSCILFLALVVSNIAIAQEAWTLQQCIDQALKNNIQIKQSSLNNDLNKVSVTQNTASMFPSINGSATQDYFFGRSIDPYTNVYTNQQIRSNSFSLSGSIPLFGAFQLQNNLKESKLNYLSSQNDLKKIQNDISLNVMNLFLQVLYNEEILKITDAQMKASEVERNRMKRMFELGSSSKGNYLEFESQYANDELKYIQAQAEYDQSILSLTQLLELDSVKSFTVVKPEILVPMFDTVQMQVDDIYKLALQTQPEVKSSEYKLLSSEKAVSAAKGALYPRLLLGGGISTNFSTSSKDVTYADGGIQKTVSGITSGGDTVYSYIPSVRASYYDTPFKNQLDNNLGKTVGFTLQVPVFNGWSSRSNVARSKINLEQSKLNNELTRKSIYKSVQQAVTDVKSSYKKFVAGQRSVDALEETFNYNQKRMDMGMINTYDYLLSKNNLLNSQASLLQSKYDYIFKIKVLDFYQGKPLSF
jgi:outer membrane protein